MKTSGRSYRGSGAFGSRDKEGDVRKIRTAAQVRVAVGVGHGLQVKTGLGVAVVQIARHEQAMSLRTDVAYGKNQVFRDLSLNSEVVLRGVLRPQLGLQFTKQQDRTKCRPIDWSPGFGSKYPVKRIGCDGELARSSKLTHKWSGKKAFRNQRATAKRGLTLELLKHQLLHRIVENSESPADRRLPIFFRIPGNSHSRRKGFVVAGGQPFGHALVPWYYKAEREHRRGIGSWVGAVRIGVTECVQTVGAKLARKNRGRLPRAKGLVSQTGVVHRLVVLPAESVVEGYVGTDLPTVLRKQIDRTAPNIFGLRGSLEIGVWQPKQIVADVAPSGIGPAPRIGVVAIRIEVQGLEEALNSEVTTNLERVIPRNSRKVVAELIGVAFLWQFT